MQQSENQNLSDEELARAYIKGDNEALNALIARYLNSVYNFIFKYVHNEYAAEDVTQEVFLKLWKNINKYDAKYKFKTWLYTIAKNTALDHLKKKGLIAFSDMVSVENEDGFYDPALTTTDFLPEKILEKIEDVSMINHAVKTLSPKYREVLTLYYNSELNFREIAQLLKESINTVKTRHRRALLTLKKQLFNK